MSLSVKLSRKFDDFQLDLDFEAPGGVTALMGPSGAGKSTIAKMIAGVAQPEHGQIQIGETVVLDTAQGLCLPPHRRNIGFVFQEPRLLPHLTVRQNLRYGAWFARKPVSDLGPVADMLGLGALLDRMPRGLSGGEAQRVALGRALLSDPNLLILDEPLAALDTARKYDILPYLARIRDQAQCPILYISHAMAEVVQLATTLLVIDAGQLRAIGPPRYVLADPDVASSLGPRNVGAILRGPLVAHAQDGLSEVAIRGGSLFIARPKAAIGSVVTLRVEASEVMLSVAKPTGLSALNILKGTITALSNGPDAGVLVQIDVAGDRVLSKLTRRSADALKLAPGMVVYAIFKSVSLETGTL